MDAGKPFIAWEKFQTGLFYSACYHKLKNHNATKTHFSFILVRRGL